MIENEKKMRGDEVGKDTSHTEGGVVRRGTAGQQIQRPESASKKTEVSYERELTVLVEQKGEEVISPVEFISYVRLMCGCRRSTGQSRYEVTMGSEAGKRKLLDGFKIRNISAGEGNFQ